MKKQTLIFIAVVIFSSFLLLVVSQKPKQPVVNTNNLNLNNQLNVIDKHFCQTEADCVLTGNDPDGFATCTSKKWNEVWEANPLSKNHTWECLLSGEEKCGCVNSKCQRIDTGDEICGERPVSLSNIDSLLQVEWHMIEQGCGFSFDGKIITNREVANEQIAREIADAFINSNSNRLNRNTADIIFKEARPSGKFKYMVRYDSYYKDVKVEGGAIEVFITKDGTITTARVGCYPKDISRRYFKVVISEKKAVEIASGLYDFPFGKEEDLPAPELVFLSIQNSTDGSFLLVWKVKFKAISFIIDAYTGAEIERWMMMRSGGTGMD